MLANTSSGEDDKAQEIPQLKRAGAGAVRSCLWRRGSHGSPFFQGQGGRRGAEPLSLPKWTLGSGGEELGTELGRAEVEGKQGRESSRTGVREGKKVPPGSFLEPAPTPHVVCAVWCQAQPVSLDSRSGRLLCMEQQESPEAAADCLQGLPAAKQDSRRGGVERIRKGAFTALLLLCLILGLSFLLCKMG